MFAAPLSSFTLIRTNVGIWMCGSITTAAVVAAAAAAAVVAAATTDISSKTIDASNLCEASSHLSVAALTTASLWCSKVD